jgi:hypothetical protein
MNNPIPTNAPSTENYLLEVDGKIKSTCRSFTEALKAGLELKQKFPHMQVKVTDACPSR